MDELRTDYKDQLLDTSVNTERRYNLIDSDGNIVQSGVSLRDVTVYSQEGDSFGAGVLNGITGAINDLSDSLNADGLQFQFATDGEGNYGYLGADGSLIPFSRGNKKVCELNGIYENGWQITKQTEATITNDGIYDLYLYGSVSGSVEIYINKNNSILETFNFTASEKVGMYFDIPFKKGDIIKMSAGDKIGSFWNLKCTIYKTN